MGIYKEYTKNLLDWVINCNHYQQDHFMNFYIENELYGKIHKDNLYLFQPYPEVFQILSNSVRLNPELNTFELRSNTIDKIAQVWSQQGKTAYWCNENYPVATSFHAQPIMLMERYVTSLFGIIKQGVHLNGLVQKKNKTFMWVAHRAKNKPTFPGKLDHLVAGGHGANLTPYETLIKESQEEAGLSEALASQAKAVGTVSYALEVNQKMVRDVIFNYDLWLAEDVVPENTDGEVDFFELWPLDEVVKRIATTDDFKTNVNLVIIDFLVRQGYLTPEDPYYVDIVHGLRGVVNG